MNQFEEHNSCIFTSNLFHPEQHHDYLHYLILNILPISWGKFYVIFSTKSWHKRKCFCQQRWTGVSGEQHFVRFHFSCCGFLWIQEHKWLLLVLEEYTTFGIPKSDLNHETRPDQTDVGNHACVTIMTNITYGIWCLYLFLDLCNASWNDSNLQLLSSYPLSFSDY